MMLVSFRPYDETSLAEIEVIALSTVVPPVFDGGGLADIAYVIIENVLLRITGEAALSDDLIVSCGEGIWDYGGLEFLLNLTCLLMGLFFFDGDLDGSLHVDIHH